MSEENTNVGGVEGLTRLSVGEAVSRLSGSKFALPPHFPSRHYASKWVEEGPAVLEAQQFEYLPGAVKAKGWDVWLQDSNTGKVTEEKKAPTKLVSFTRVVGKRTYVLMCRPKALQTAVRGIYADQSRQRTGQVINGEVNPVANAEDPNGIITEHQLNRYAGRERDEGENYMKPSAGSQPTRLHVAGELELQSQ